MLSLDNRTSLEGSLNIPMHPQLHRLLAERVHDAAKSDLLDLTHLLVVQPGDCEHDIVNEISMSPLTNPLDGSRFTSPHFMPWWDFMTKHEPDWYEILICCGNSGFAYILLIQDAEGVQTELRELCRTYAE
jgi:hypothetical protein